MLKNPQNSALLATIKVLGTSLSVAFLAGPSCLRGPSFMSPSKGGLASNQRTPLPVGAPAAVSQSQVSGTTVAKINSQSAETQEVAVPNDSDVSGTKIGFPPGSLSIDTEISIQESTPVATGTATAELGIQATISSASKAVSVQPTSYQTDPIQPFTVTLALPASGLSAGSLNLADGNIFVVYRVFSYAEGKTLVGVIPSQDIEKGDRSVRFFTRYFGAFQAAYSSVPVTKAQSVISTIPVQTKKEVQNLPPLTVNGRSPVVVPRGGKVIISGQNFRPTLAIALGGKTVGELKVMSDSQASFVAPADVGFGLNSMELVQDGTAQTISIFYKGDKSDFPIMTEVPENVCSGSKYYDQTGALKVGTKSCQSAPAAASCSKTGETNCLASTAFPAVANSELVAGNIKKGASIGGVTGIYPSPEAPLAANTAVVDLTSFGPTLPVGAYEFFDSAGNVYPASILDGGTITPSTVSQSLSSTGSLYRGVTVSGNADLLASNIKSGVNLFGVSGSLTPAPANCSSAAQTGCVTTATYKSMDLSQMGASSATGLTAANFDTKLTSGANFEFWDASGGRHMKAGDVDLTAANVNNTVVIFGVTGTLTGAPANCNTNGQQNCVATASYFGATACSADSSNCFVPTYATTTQPLKAISYDAIDAGKSSIRSSLTLSGIAGTLADCTTNYASGCVTTASYKSADWTNLTAANIKNGASVAGLTGTYPSSGNLLTSASATADLDQATFDAKVKSASTFEFFGPDGTRYTNSGDADITAANIASGVTIFGTTGTIPPPQCTSGAQVACEADTACRWNTGVCEINPWHIRAGVTVASKAGSLKANCRNTINSTYYNWDGAVASLLNTSQSGGTAYDFWDTIEDYSGYPANKVSAWSSNTQCDSSNWTDVTTTDGGTSLTTCGTSSTCIYRDELSGLRVTGVLSSGNITTNTASPASFTWSNAIKACASSTYGGYTAGTWRLPTQKELMSLYEHGIASSVSASFHTISNLQDYYWSSSTNSLSTVSGWYVILGAGITEGASKTLTYKALCVF